MRTPALLDKTLPPLSPEMAETADSLGIDRPRQLHASGLAFAQIAQFHPMNSWRRNLLRLPCAMGFGFAVQV
ncbi:MAG: hypothetical protein I8H91_12905 [Burkholderiales bacterium]|nr:hypothetical protein [Burkholderiales bacterium]